MISLRCNNILKVVYWRLFRLRGFVIVPGDGDEVADDAESADEQKGEGRRPGY